MTVTTYTAWTAAGSPARPAQPIADMVAMFRAAGYTGTGYYPDERHLQADPPEDHTPYSHTPWPGSQPYPLILALDLMPHREGDGRSLAPIARRVIADKRAGRAPWIKYINWTDEAGKVWHTRWQPNEVMTSSTDSGHVHISIRTDYATSTAARGWDPTNTPGDEMLDLTQALPGTKFEGDPSPTAAERTLGLFAVDQEQSLNPFKRVWQAETLWNTRDIKQALAAAQKSLDALTAAWQAIAAGGGNADTAAILAAIKAAGDAESQIVAGLHDQIAQLAGQVADLQHKLAAAERASADALA